MIASTKLEKCLRSNGERTFSILIPTWNNLSYLKVCLDSIFKNSVYNHQVIVHVNEGNDGTLEWLKQQEQVDYTWSDKNIGVCYALNLGRTLVQTDYIVYVNDDMYLCPGWDEALLKEINAIGHKMFFLSATPIEPVASSNCVIEKDYGNSVETFREESLLNEFRQLPFHDWQGSTWPPNIVHRDVWDLCGGYSIEFSPGLYSDPDFSMKLWQMGIRLFKGVSASRAYHFGSKSTGRVKKNRGYYTFISKWGITSSTLTRFMLRRGKKFDGPLPDFTADGMLKFKNFLKNADVLFRRGKHS